MVRVGLTEKETSEQGLEEVGKQAAFLGEGPVKCAGPGFAGPCLLCVMDSREASVGRKDETGLAEETSPHRAGRPL